MTAEPEGAPPPEAPAPPARWSERDPALAAVTYAAAYLTLAAAGGRLAELLRSPLPQALLVAALGLGCTVLSLLLVLSVCRVRIARWAQVGLFVLTTVVCLVARPEVTAALAQWWHLPQQVSAHIPAGFPGDTLIGNLALILWATLIGRQVARIVRDANLLLPVAVVASLADIITVFWGFVAHATRTAPTVVAALSVRVPVAEVPPAAQFLVLTYIGIGDFLFLAIFLTAALRHRMRAAAAMWAAFVAMVVAAPLVDLSAYGLPGLPFISAGVVWVNRRFFRFSAEEKRALAVVGGLLVALIGAAVVVLLRRHR